jgi:hypothetical protein
MAEQNDNKSYLEFFDITKKECVVRTPLTESRFMPRKGERIFISPHGPGSWVPYTVIGVEYFFGYDNSSSGPSPRGDSSRITLYIEEAK